MSRQQIEDALCLIFTRQKVQYCTTKRSDYTKQHSGTVLYSPVAVLQALEERGLQLGQEGLERDAPLSQ